jgi:RNA recognition motif-containing protein
MEGAYDVLIRPVDHDMLRMALRRASDTHALRCGNSRSSKQNCILMIQGLGKQANVELVKLLFNPYGKVIWCRLVVDSNAPAFAYVELERPEDAQRAVEGLTGRTVLGYSLILSLCIDTLDRRVHS